jgi:hypothetical protein
MPMLMPSSPTTGRFPGTVTLFYLLYLPGPGLVHAGAPGQIMP